jgi:hypothetical protein
MNETTGSDARGARQRAVKHLETLYAAVVAVGLGVAVNGTVTVTGDHLDVKWDHVPLVAALLFTLVPFFQGALLHLDNKYRRDDVGSHPTLVPLVDFAFLFLEAVVIVALAASVADVRSFLVAAAALLALDVIWASVSFRLARTIPSPDQRAGCGSDEELGEWIRINRITLGVFALGFLGHFWVTYPGWMLTTIAAVGALVRSAVDYRLNHEFYAGEQGPPLRQVPPPCESAK